MWLTRLSIQRPVFVIVLMATFVIVGLFCRGRMQVEQNPRVDIPYVTVSSTYAGTGPAEMETLVTKPIEDAVSSVDGIRNIRSSSQYGVSYVQLEFFLGTNSYIAAQEVRQKVDGIRRQLPRDMDPPSVDRYDVNALPVLYAGIKGNRSIKQLRFMVDTNIKYRLAQVPGVGQVSVTGGDVRELRISVDKRRLEAWGISMNDVVSAIYRANLDFPSGHITEGARDYDARLIGLFENADQMGNLDLAVPSGSGIVNLKLRDVATVNDTTAERETVTRIWMRDHPGHPMEGRDSVGITITKLADANTVEVVDGVKAAMTRLEKELPGNIRFQITQDESVTVRDALEDINVALIIGALLAVIVVFLFLHNLRGTLICAIAIPTSLIATFIPMYFMGQSLNNMTMLGLSLVVGILVDDSIVVLENIYRHLHKGETPTEAALNGRGEIGNAAIIITLVDVVVFLPMVWMGGIIGQYFRAFGLTVAVATLFSLLVSFTVTPWLASRWYRLGEDLEHKSGFFHLLENGLNALDRGYRRVLDWALGTPRWFAVVVCLALVLWLVRGGIPHGTDWAWFGVLATCLVLMLLFISAGWWQTAGRMSVFSLGVLLFVFTMQVYYQQMKIGYYPTADQSQLAVSLELQPGASLYETDRVTRKVEAAIAQIPEVESVFTVLGTIQGGARAIPENGYQYGQLAIRLYRKPDVLETLNPFANPADKKEDFRKRSDTAIAAEIRQRTAGIPGVQVAVYPIREFAGAAAPVEVQLLGFDLNEMRRTAEQVRASMATIPGVLNPDISQRPGKPELQVVVDRTKASALGLDVSDIGNAMRNGYQGDNNSKYQDPQLGEQFDIRVQFPDLQRVHAEELASIPVGRLVTGTGNPTVRLNQVATTTLGEGPNKIDRKNRLRQVTVSAYVLPGVVPMKINEVVESRLKALNLRDIKVDAGGDAEQARTDFPFLFSSLALSFILVYLLMAVLFDNLLHPLTIQLSLPMALIGAVAALVWSDQMLSLVSITGFIMLAGIVQKNAILLIDYINTLRARGYDRDTAIKEAGPTRLRPILMTTLAMVFGMLPIALSIGRASEERAPLAICVIGGLIVSTVLSLVVIPCIFSVFDDVQTWLARAMGKGRRSVLVEHALAEDAE